MTRNAENGAPAPCRFGFVEYDGARYCHEHGDFLEPGVLSRQCTTARPGRCVRCGAAAKFDAGGGRWVHDDPAVSLGVDHAARVIPPGSSRG